mmetsp:Transcript_18769/g.61384  ORF Transcript_18769/g.61384 Transcript_18769/m.61384 type:complete len:257 (+) Transcript_18769:187-957(+)
MRHSEGASASSTASPSSATARLTSSTSSAACVAFPPSPQPSSARRAATCSPNARAMANAAPSLSHTKWKARPPSSSTKLKTNHGCGGAGQNAPNSRCIPGWLTPNSTRSLCSSSRVSPSSELSPGAWLMMRRSRSRDRRTPRGTSLEQAVHRRRLCVLSRTASDTTTPRSSISARRPLRASLRRLRASTRNRRTSLVSADASHAPAPPGKSSPVPLANPDPLGDVSGASVVGTDLLPAEVASSDGACSPPRRRADA